MYSWRFGSWLFCGTGIVCVLNYRSYIPERSQKFLRIQYVSGLTIYNVIATSLSPFQPVNYTAECGMSGLHFMSCLVSTLFLHKPKINTLLVWVPVFKHSNCLGATMFYVCLPLSVSVCFSLYKYIPLTIIVSTLLTSNLLENSGVYTSLSTQRSCLRHVIIGESVPKVTFTRTIVENYWSTSLQQLGCTLQASYFCLVRPIIS